MQADQPITYLSKALGEKHRQLSIYESFWHSLWLWKSGGATYKDKSSSS
jgi:hypothetical protein